MAPSDRRKRRSDRIRQKRGKNTSFNELCSLLEAHGWTLERIARDNHYLYVHPDYEGIVNVPRPHQGSEVKSVYCRNALQAIKEVAGYE